MCHASPHPTVCRTPLQAHETVRRKRRNILVLWKELCLGKPEWASETTRGLWTTLWESLLWSLELGMIKKSQKEGNIEGQQSDNYLCVQSNLWTHISKNLKEHSFFLGGWQYIDKVPKKGAISFQIRENMGFRDSMISLKIHIHNLKILSSQPKQPTIIFYRNIPVNRKTSI